MDQRCNKSESVFAVGNAARRPVSQPIRVSNRIPQGFFDDTLNPAHFSTRHHLHSLLPPSHGSTLRIRFLSSFRTIHRDVHDTPSRPRPFQWVRNRLSSSVDIELPGRLSAVVDVPYAKGKRRNACAAIQWRSSSPVGLATTCCCLRLHRTPRCC